MKLIKQGAVIAIRNGRIRIIKNHISLEIDIFGRVTAETVDVKENTKENISEKEIERRPRRKEGEDRPRRTQDGEERPRRNRDEGREERPRRNYDNEERPKRNYDNEERPKRTYDNEERPKRTFNNEDRPRRYIRFYLDNLEKTDLQEKIDPEELRVELPETTKKEEIEDLPQPGLRSEPSSQERRTLTLLLRSCLLRSYPTERRLELC